MVFAIKAEIRDPRAKTFAFNGQKTMYGGKHIAERHMIFLLASENEGGQGLIAPGVVTSTESIANKRGIARQTPRGCCPIGGQRASQARGDRSDQSLKRELIGQTRISLLAI